jgi:cell division protein FtsZ
MVDFEHENLMEITPCIEDSHKRSSIIKVMGVGGGGSNAVRHMYNMGITDVDFMICNTDKQALNSNPIPVKIQLGESGLGAGAMPDVARQAALDSEETIKAALEGTKMLFVTAGMGGGTGTGASPIVASIARDLGILTVGIVTYPFKFEQKDKSDLADEGISELSQNVDAIIVIKNEALKSFYPDLKVSNAFAKVDDVLLIAAKSIAELITLESIINVDFNDVRTILKDSGTALIGSGEAEGEERAMEAVEAAINSPLLDQNSIYGAEKLLFFFSYSSENELSIIELTKITDQLENKTCTICKKLIWGHGIDDSLGDKVRVTVIATGLHNNAEIVSGKQNNSEKNENTKKNPIVIPLDPVYGENNHSVMQENENTVDEPKSAKGLFSNLPDNNQLRRKSEDEVTDYLNTPAYYREQQLKNYSANEISNYKAGINGLECMTPAFLSNVVD